MNNTTAPKVMEMPATLPASDRNSWTKTAHEKIDKISSTVNVLKDEATRLAGDLKTKADDKWTKLETKYQELKGKLETFKSATDEQWQTDKKHMEESFDELSTNFKNLFS